MNPDNKYLADNDSGVTYINDARAFVDILNEGLKTGQHVTVHALDKGYKRNSKNAFKKSTQCDIVNLGPEDTRKLWVSGCHGSTIFNAKGIVFKKSEYSESINIETDTGTASIEYGRYDIDGIYASVGMRYYRLIF